MKPGEVFFTEKDVFDTLTTNQKNVVIFCCDLAFLCLIPQILDEIPEFTFSFSKRCYKHAVIHFYVLETNFLNLRHTACFIK